jgi:hypothetical protein
VHALDGETLVVKLRDTNNFRCLALLYVASLSSVSSPKTIETRIQHLDNPLLDYFGGHAVDSLSAQSVEKFVFRMEAAGWASAKIQACLVTFRACMKYALDQDWAVDARLSKPVSVDTPCLASDAPLMANNEFLDLYQSLVQDITKDMYH